MVCAEHLLSSWGSKVLEWDRQRLPLWTFPNRSFGCWDSNRLPWAKTLYRGCCLFKAGGGVGSAWASWEAEIIKNLHTDCPQNPSVSFPLIIQLGILLHHYIWAVTTAACWVLWVLSTNFCTWGVVLKISNNIYNRIYLSEAQINCIGTVQVTTPTCWREISTNWTGRNLCYLSSISPKLGMKIMYLIKATDDLQHMNF